MQSDLEAAWSSLRMQIDAHRPLPRQYEGKAEHSVPVCILTGFLGSGKSTLLAHLLTRPPAGVTIRALVNDIGTLQFDPSIVGAADAVRVELINGCGCCVATDDVLESLRALVRDGACSSLVVEASGAADPVALAQVVDAVDGLHHDRTVAVVDAHQVGSADASSLTGALFRRQLDSAHVVVLSHCDDLGSDDIARIKNVLAGFAPGRIIYDSTVVHPTSHALLPSSPLGARPAPTGTSTLHLDLHVVTITETREVSCVQFSDVVAQSRPGLIRAKGRLKMDGGVSSVQVTPSGLDFSPGADGPLGLTVIASSPSDAEALVSLVAGNDHS